jgi:murein DD-endopeptidase MepM/ murein hydrolase activator NlpD
MRQTAFWSSCGRGACGVLAAAGVALAVSGCSSSSRFDFPAFNLTNSSDASTDLTTTSALPVPPESVYSAGGSQGDAQVARSSLPPPSYTPRPADAAYSPAPSGRVRAEQANYAAQGAAHAEPAVLRPGQQGQGRRVKVAKGDTLSILARRYGVSVEAIMGANNLPDGRLAIGQELIIPGGGSKAVETAAAAPAGPESTYKVQKGDTPNGIAEKLGVDEKALIARNKIRANRLQIGQVLVIPGKGSGPVVAAKETKPAKPKTTPDVHVVKTTTIPAPGGTSLAEEEAQSAGYGADSKPNSKPDKKPGASAGEIAASSEITGEEKPRVASTDQLPTPEPMSGNSFRWPVKGRVISEFGAKPDGGHNDGIDVAVPQGTSVKAAENGVVAYAGSELKGYGNLVLVRHANNWVSAYAHNEEILVKRGDKVRRGQIIAKAGATGSVTQPQVHFELRKGSRPVDPTKFMSDQAASAD